MILILGYGVSGKACMALLRQKGIPAIAVDKQAMFGAHLDRPDFPLDGVETVVLSPGISSSHPIVQRAIAANIPVIGEVEFAMRWMENRCIGITGSNGKTTTALLTAHALNCSGIKAKVVGNVGLALSHYLLEADPEEILILELSSFQLETLRAKKLDLALILNILPNHLDRYASLEEYAAAKANIRHCLKEGAKLFVSRQVTLDGGISGTIFDLAAISSEEYTQLYCMPMQNILAAKALCAEFGVGAEMFAKTIGSFQKPPHRVEWVAELDGVRYYNDSKATSVEAVIHAVSFVRGPIVLIAGGVDKGAPYGPWVDAFRGKVEKIVAYGEAAEKMERELASDYPLERVPLFADAIRAAQRSAKPGVAVLLSPGCSSYDQFQNYEHRGDAFKRLVRSDS